MTKENEKNLFERVSLENLHFGAIFETEDGIRAVKSAYTLTNTPPTEPLCVLLESGEFVHLPELNSVIVKEIKIP